MAQPNSASTNKPNKSDAEYITQRPNSLPLRTARADVIGQLALKARLDGFAQLETDGVQIEVNIEEES